MGIRYPIAVGRARTTIAVGLLVAIVTGALAIAWPGSVPGYLLQQGVFGAELLWGRVPVASVADDPRFTASQRERLAWIPEIQGYGQRIGLATTDKYTVINPDWDRKIWNVSACDPLAFRPVAWRFPIVGALPYIGFFRESDAYAWATDMRGEGLDVYVRTAGAFSMLGWFTDPVLPDMLAWSEHQLAGTLLHEDTHATLWVPGSAEFNESFANFVGEKAALGYLAERYGDDSPEVAAARSRLVDQDTFVATLHDIHVRLDAVYADPALSPTEKMAKKRAIFAALPVDIARAPFQNPAPWVRWARSGTWNNARMIQFRTYHRSLDQFQVVLDANGGDLAAFIANIDAITRDARDPYVALAEAVSQQSDSGSHRVQAPDR